jgi:hypothetical protein
MDQMFISISADAASDSWGFVGVVSIGDTVAYRTMEAFRSPLEAQRMTRDIIADVLGEMLAAAEWRRVRDNNGAVPTRRDIGLGLLSASRRSAADEGDLKN